MNRKKVDCYSCQHFELTYQLPLNKICQSFGFKSEELPAIIVYKSTGHICNGYLPKKKKHSVIESDQPKDKIKEKSEILNKKTTEWYG